MSDLPDFDEYFGMSATDIAHAVINWPDGSEDQIRAIGALRALVPDRHHNRPPLAEALQAETEGWRRRSGEILALAGEALIVDDESARKVSDLAATAKDLVDEIDAARLARTKPLRDSVKLANDVYGEVIEPLKHVQQTMRQMLTVHDNKVRAAAEVQRRLLFEEQRQREAAAAEAQRKADEAARAGAAGQVNAELQAAQAREAADQARLRAEAVRPSPIRSHLGQVQRRREVKHEITDLAVTVAWLLEQAGYRSKLQAAVYDIVTAYLKSLGVDEVARSGATIPGVKVTVELGTAGVRR